MSDPLIRLAGRTLGLLPVLQPRLLSMFAVEDGGEESPLAPNSGGAGVLCDRSTLPLTRLPRSVTTSVDPVNPIPLTPLERGDWRSEGDLEPGSESRVEPRVEPRVESRVEFRVEPSIESKVKSQVESSIESSFKAGVEPGIEFRDERMGEILVQRLPDPSVSMDRPVLPDRPGLPVARLTSPLVPMDRPTLPLTRLPRSLMRAIVEMRFERRVEPEQSVDSIDEIRLAPDPSGSLTPKDAQNSSVLGSKSSESLIENSSVLSSKSSENLLANSSVLGSNPSGSLMPRERIDRSPQALDSTLEPKLELLTEPKSIVLIPNPRKTDTDQNILANRPQTPNSGGYDYFSSSPRIEDGRDDSPVNSVSISNGLGITPLTTLEYTVEYTVGESIALVQPKPIINNPVNSQQNVLTNRENNRTTDQTIDGESDRVIDRIIDDTIDLITDRANDFVTDRTNNRIINRTEPTAQILHQSQEKSLQSLQSLLTDLRDEPQNSFQGEAITPQTTTLNGKTTPQPIPTKPQQVTQTNTVLPPPDLKVPLSKGDLGGSGAVPITHNFSHLASIDPPNSLPNLQSPQNWGFGGEQPDNGAKKIPTIAITIGRISIRAVPPAAPPPTRSPRSTRPQVSLNDYLKSRNGGNT
jgi:hypothetical protein